MITCFIGTRAQLIKMAPVILEMERRNLDVNLVFTGQHKETMDQLIRDFGIKTRGVYLYTGAEITSITHMGKWFLGCLWKALRQSEIFAPKGAPPNILLVHGDTFSTLLGAIIGKLRRIPVAHIEAGLRSYNLFHPFPEELTRLAVFRLAEVAFCPGTWAYENMGKYPLKRVNTTDNTLRDAITIALSAPPKANQALMGSAYGICSIHRFENIFNEKRLATILELIEKAAARCRLVFVLHPATRKKLIQFGFMARLEKNTQITLLPRMGYFEFVQLMQGARFVITDGGGNQEELSYLGVPTLLMRKATERKEGLGSTAILSAYDANIIEQFLSNIDNKESLNINLTKNPVFPSRQIVDHIETLQV